MSEYFSSILKEEEESVEDDQLINMKQQADFSSLRKTVEEEQAAQ